MPNIIDADGIQTNTQAELIAADTAAFELIYGPGIDLDQDTPDGQMMMIRIQAILDLEDLITQVNAMFDPDQAVGVVLDQRVAINGIQRNEGSYTITPVSLSLTGATTLYGLDQDTQPIYTVQSGDGNLWFLETTQTPSGAGTFAYAFRAAQLGAVIPIPNTIQIPVTINLAVSAVNNPNAYTTLGTPEETDAALRIRRQQSVSISSQGFYNSLKAALLNVTGVTSATIEENDDDAANSDGVPGHSIWVIVSGSGAAADIAQAIYTKRNAGCGMYNSGDSGAQSYNVLQDDGSYFTVYWDTVVEEDLFIKFTATSLDGINPPSINVIKAYLAQHFVPGVNQQVNINELATLVQDADPNTLVTNSGFSTSAGGAYTNTLEPSSKNKQFVVSEANVIVLPMILSPTTATLTSSGDTLQYTALGGYGTMAFTIFSGGGSVGASTGLYTSAGSGSTVVRVTDSLGNHADATVVTT